MTICIIITNLYEKDIFKIFDIYSYLIINHFFHTIQTSIQLDKGNARISPCLHRYILLNQIVSPLQYPSLHRPMKLYVLHEQSTICQYSNIKKRDTLTPLKGVYFKMKLTVSSSSSTS